MQAFDAATEDTGAQGAGALGEHAMDAAFYCDRFSISPDAVRDALSRLVAALVQAGPAMTATIDTAACEIVLAEVLNNIAEHAYAEVAGGPVRVRAASTPCGIIFEVEDRGPSLPPALLVPPPEPSPDGSDVGSLAEGGYGWFMIHSLTRDLKHRRVRGWNRLQFVIPGG